MQFRDERNTAVIVCTGQSAGRIDRTPARRFARIVVNDGYILEPDADALYAADERWWKWHGPTLAAQFKGTLYAPLGVGLTACTPTPLNVVRLSGLSRTPGTVHTGEVGNSGGQAINLAYLLGARRIVLIGMDMGGTHFFGDHPPGISRNHSGFQAMVRSMSQMACELDAAGVQVINTSDCSRIGYWPGGRPIPID